jgi:hypothetical protein
VAHDLIVSKAREVLNGTCCLKRAHTHTWVFPTRLSPTQRVYRAPPTLRSLIHLSDDWNQLIQQKHAKDRTQQPDTQKLHSTQSFATQCKYQPVPSKRQPFCPPKSEGVRHIRNSPFIPKPFDLSPFAPNVTIAHPERRSAALVSVFPVGTTALLSARLGCHSRSTVLVSALPVGTTAILSAETAVPVCST